MLMDLPSSGTALVMLLALLSAGAETMAAKFNFREGMENRFFEQNDASDQGSLKTCGKNVLTFG